MKAKLILENGTVFEGNGFGYFKDTIGEIVFTTGMVGYQEIITDPIYFGQIVVMTYPLIGNYGVNLEDIESDRIQVSGLIVREKCDIPNNFRCEISLDNYLKQNKIMGLCGIDTRALTKVLRNEGTMKGIIVQEDTSKNDIKSRFKDNLNDLPVKEVSRKDVLEIKGRGKNIVILDLGINNSTLKWLKEKEFNITILPYTASKDEILNRNPDLLFVSQGPGNPCDLNKIIKMIKELVGKVPLVGLGLGHQIIALSMGESVKKLKYGHRGSNHPVKWLDEDKVIITTQNHGYYVENIKGDLEVTHINVNDGTIAGLRNDKLKIRTLQFSPEAAMGTEGCNKLFEFLLRDAL